MNRQRTLLTLAALALGLGLASNASALSIDGVTGEITDWGFTPFNNTQDLGDWGNGAPPLASGINGTQSGTEGGITFTEGNNSSPINYPGTSSPYTPAPGGADGEVFDNEFLGWRIVGDGTVAGSQIEFLGISSVNPFTGSTFNGTTFNIGDVFIDVDGDGSTGFSGYDLALGMGAGWSTSLNDPLHPADGPYSTEDFGVYAIDSVDDVHGITDEGGYGFDNAISAATNPFAVRDGAVGLGGSLSRTITSFDYGNVFGANEDDTFITEYIISGGDALLAFDLDGNGFLDDLGLMTLHWTIECGNDLIQTEPVIPEPASLLLVGMGLGAAGMVSRRRRQVA